MTGIPKFGTSKGYKVVPFSDFCKSPQIKYLSCRSILLHLNDMTDRAQPLDVKALHKVHVVEKLIRLTVKSNAEYISNSHRTDDIKQVFYLKYSQHYYFSAS